MDLLSGLPISPLFFLLIGVVFLLLIVEIIYLLHKRKQSAPVSSPTQNFVVPPTPSSHAFPWQWALLAGILLVILSVAGVGYYIATKEAESPESQAHTFIRDGDQEVDKLDKCGVELGSVSDNPSGMGKDPNNNSNTYSLTYSIRNKQEEERGVRMNNRWFACTFNDQDICGGDDPNAHGDKNRDNEEIMLGPGETKDFTVTATQPEGDCGMFQVDIDLKSVYKDGAWDDSCNSNDSNPGIGGLYWNSNACGEEPSVTPSITPSITTTVSVSVTPSITPSITPPGPSNTPIPGACVNLKFYAVDGENLFSAELTMTDLKDLKLGEKVNITVLGDSQTSSAKLSVNDSQWKSLPQMRVSPTSTVLKEYYDSANLFDIANYPTKMSFVFLGEVN